MGTWVERLQCSCWHRVLATSCVLVLTALAPETQTFNSLWNSQSSQGWRLLVSVLKTQASSLHELGITMLTAWLRKSITFSSIFVGGCFRTLGLSEVLYNRPPTYCRNTKDTHQAQKSSRRRFRSLRSWETRCVPRSMSWQSLTRCEVFGALHYPWELWDTFKRKIFNGACWKGFKV